MNILEHILCAEVSLEMAKEKITRNDFFGAKSVLAQVQYHTIEVLDHVQKLEASKANLELTERGP